MTDWTEAQEATLRRMYADGALTGEMMAALGMSRGAICGKVHRLKLSRGRIVRNITSRSAPKAAARSVSVKNSHATLAQRLARRAERSERALQQAAAFEALEVVDLAPDESASAVPFIKLSAQTCRWPLGDPRDLAAMRFCGAEPNGQGPYCARHHRMAYAGYSLSEAVA